MKIKGKILTDPYLDNVTEFPYALEGTCEISWGGDNWFFCRFFIDGDLNKETFGFGVQDEEKMFSESDVIYDEIANGLKVRVFIMPLDGEFSTEAENGKLKKYQTYIATKFERIESTT